MSWDDSRLCESAADLMKSRRSSIHSARELRLIMDRYSSMVKRQPSLQGRHPVTSGVCWAMAA